MKPFAKALAILCASVAVLFVGFSLLISGSNPDASAVKTVEAPDMQVTSLGTSCKAYHAASTAPGRPALPAELKALSAFKALDGDVVMFGKRSPEPSEANYAARLKEYIETPQRTGCHVANTITWADDATTVAADTLGKIVAPPTPPEPVKADTRWRTLSNGDEARYINSSRTWTEYRRKDPITDESRIQTCGTEWAGALAAQMNKAKGLKPESTTQNLLCWGGKNPNITFSGGGERLLYDPYSGAAQVDVKFEMLNGEKIVESYTTLMASSFTTLLLPCGNRGCENSDFVTKSRAADTITVRFKAADGSDIVLIYAGAALDPSIQANRATTSSPTRTPAPAPAFTPAPVPVEVKPPSAKSPEVKAESDSEIHGKSEFNVSNGATLRAILGQETVAHIVSYVRQGESATFISDVPCVSHNERAAGVTSFKLIGGSSTAYKGCAYTSASGEFLVDYAQVGRAPDNNIEASEFTSLPQYFR